MTTEHEPNEYGFSGAGTAPDPEIKPVEHVDAENIAVPAGDITGALTHAIEEITQDDDGEDER